MDINFILCILSSVAIGILILSCIYACLRKLFIVLKHLCKKINKHDVENQVGIMMIGDVKWYIPSNVFINENFDIKYQNT